MELIDDELDLQPYLSLPEDHNAVRPASLWLQQVQSHFQSSPGSCGLLLPWKKTHEDIRIRPSELSIWAGVNGHGKSILLNQVILQILVQQQRACIASFEMKPQETMARMTCQATGTGHPNEGEVQSFLDWTNEKLWLYDRIGQCDSKTVFAIMRYCVENLGLEHFVIDSLTKCGLGVDDYNSQKSFIDSLSTYAKDSGVHIHLVAHSRKRDSEYGSMGKFDIKGTSEISDLADNVFLVSRNKRKEEERYKPSPSEKILSQPDAWLRCDKQRHGGSEGTYGLWFDSPSMQFFSKPYCQPVRLQLGD